MYFVLCLFFLLVSSAINRKAVVTKHNLNTVATDGNYLDLADIFSLGNGGFAFNVDPTGLQTLNWTYASSGPHQDLNILSDWGWHSLPGTPKSRAPLTQFNFTYYPTATNGAGGFRMVPYATDSNLTDTFRDYTSLNPHRLALGQLTLRLVQHNTPLGRDPLPIPPAAVTQIDSLLDIWGGSYTSSFVLKPTGVRYCGEVNEGGTLTLTCADDRAIISALDFASYGTALGSCPNWTLNPTCNAANTTKIVSTACLGKQTCSIPANNQLFGDPCLGMYKSLRVIASCTLPPPEISSTFHITTETVVHPDIDLIATRVSCTRLTGVEGCPTALRLAFSYSTGGWGPSSNDWNPDFDNRHTSTAVTNTSTRLTVQRTVDDAIYLVDCSWDDNSYVAIRTGPHAFSLLPPPNSNSTVVELSCLFAPLNARYPIGMTSSPYIQAKSTATLALLNSAKPFPNQATVTAAAASEWSSFWMSGGFVDLASNNVDPDATELQRRIILSRYLTRVHSAGASPPQETGLFSNSWSGRFHLEMRWWHQAHFPLWGNPELLERTNAFYFDLLPNATSLARFQGYPGARWLKMLGLANTGNPATAIDVSWLGTDFTPPPEYARSGLLLLWEAANLINPVLTWNQPHMIWLADLQRRSVNASQGPVAAMALVVHLAPLVFATADFCASYPIFNETSNRYEFVPPTLGAEEFGDFMRITRPVFESVYFAYVLDIANDWRVLLGLAPNPLYARVAANLGIKLPLDPAMHAPTYSFNALAACCYVDPSACPNGRFGGLDQCSPLTGHPSPAAILGMINGRIQGDRYGVDVVTANNTIATIVDNWGWASGGAWGWDNPLVAMGMIRLGWAPQAAVKLLLKQAPANTYLRNGFNYMAGGNFMYLPGNGGTLSAIAMMAAGTSTSPPNNFPPTWKAESEGFLFPYP